MSFQTLSISRSRWRKSVAGEVAGAQPVMSTALPCTTAIDCTIKLSSSSPLSSPDVSRFYSVNRRRHIKSSSSSSLGNNSISAKNGVRNSVKPATGSKNEGQRKKSRNLSLKSLLGRRSMWKRILFASTKTRSIILLNVTAIIYASNISVVKEIEGVVDPGIFNVVRFASAAIPFLPFVLRVNDTRTRNAGIELGFWVSLGYLMQAIGLLTSDAGRASFLSMLTIVVVPLLDGMLGSVIPARTWFGALMSMFGVVMLESSGSPPCVGDLLNFLSALFFGVHMLRTEHISRSTSKEDFISLLGYEMLVVALVSTLWYFIGGSLFGTQSLSLSDWTWSTFWSSTLSFPWIPALYTGLFSTGLCLWIEMASMCNVSATETAIVYGLEPVWGAGFAWFLLGERWGLSGWIGAALVLGGSLSVQILGASSSPLSGQVEKVIQDDELSISDKRNNIRASPLVIREDPTDLLRKS
ncbi:hypothetical protein K7X08_004454 [Anisodus acutangulus]|uniref:EamA domain-containing protein n=1 Tax=Anisodus acutangulus TaxID=402998 RepID=A0A9Q1LYF4_9SOLA|nr:hypothetical protein K7X08_004454 [Anisodus acutangulus]